VPDQERYPERQREPTEPERVDLHPRSLPAPDAERFGPIAPEPKWEKPEPYFNRERFLLRLVAWIIGVQFSFYIVGTLACTEIARVKLNLLINQSNKQEGPAPFCVQLPDKLQNSVDQGLAVLLALLGGGALALSERREQPRQDPRRRGGDQP
jgi:hypothetical protein